MVNFVGLSTDRKKEASSLLNKACAFPPAGSVPITQALGTGYL